MKFSVSDIAKIGLLCSLSLIFSYVESLIPFLASMPAVKMGLSNIVVVYGLYAISAPAAFIIMIMRVLLSAFLFQGAFSIIYGLVGGFLSLIVMYLLKKTDQFSLIATSIAGGVAHNLGQFFVAASVLSFESVSAYLPILIISGLVAGFFIGIISTKIIKIINSRGK